jgi:hypothetical protein
MFTGVFFNHASVAGGVAGTELADEEGFITTVFIAN